MPPCWALPTDVRRGYAPPLSLSLQVGCAPGPGSALTSWAKGHTRGIAQILFAANGGA